MWIRSVIEMLCSTFELIPKKTLVRRGELIGNERRKKNCVCGEKVTIS